MTPEEKQTKILDILKKKEVCIQMLKHILKLDKKDVLEYGYTEEEYDLLKEWLKNDQYKSRKTDL